MVVQQITQHAHNAYDASLNGQYIGSFASELEAHTALDLLAYRLIAAGEIAPDSPQPTAPTQPTNPLATIDRAKVGAVVASARAKVASDTRWLNAINRAYAELELNQWLFTGRVLVVASRTSAKRYHVTATTCECQAAAKGRPCWHRAAHRLLSRAALAH